MNSFEYHNRSLVFVVSQKHTKFPTSDDEDDESGSATVDGQATTSPTLHHHLTVYYSHFHQLRIMAASISDLNHNVLFLATMRFY